jgi:hypothetical protein
VSKSCRATSISPWTRPVAGFVAALAAGTVVGIAPVHAAESDQTAPVFIGATLTREVIDVVDGPVDVTIRVEAEDLGSGINPTSFVVDPEPDSGMGRDPVQAKGVALVSGDQFRGVYEATFTFPEYIANGNWVFSAIIRDNAGNGNFDYNGSATMGVTGRYTSIRSNPDMTAPTVTTSVSTKIVDITDGPVEVVVTAEGQDDGVGIPLDAQTMAWSRTGSSGSGYYVKNSSTDPHHAKFTKTVPFGKYDPAYDTRGKYRFSFREIADGNGNAIPGEHSAGEVTVATRPLRAKRPNLVVEGTNLKTSWAAHTDPLGILEYEVEVKSSEQTKTVKTTALEVVHAELPAGTYTARVRARNQLGWGEWTTPSVPVVYSLGSMTASAPTVSGTAKVGQTLAAIQGPWTPGATIAYRWLANGVAVPGANTSTLALTPAQVGKAITVRVVGSKPGFVTTSRFSAPTAAVAPGSLAGAATVITGTPRVGSTLTAKPGNWSPAPVNLSYQWYRSGVTITGATASTYALTAADLGKTVTVKITARKTGYTAAGKTSAPTTAIAGNVMTAVRPTITGTARVGETLAVKTGTWSPTGVTFTYQWNRQGSPIPGATGASYKVVSADLGKGLSVRIVGRKSGYVAKGAISNFSSAVIR